MINIVYHTSYGFSSKKNQEVFFMGKQEFDKLIRYLYYEEAINYVTQKQYEPVEPVPKNPRLFDQLNCWGIEMLAFGLMKGLEMGAEMMKKENVL